MDEDVVQADGSDAEDAVSGSDDPEPLASDKQGKSGGDDPGILIGL
jgi:hypothetical protein